MLGAQSFLFWSPFSLRHEFKANFPQAVAFSYSGEVIKVLFLTNKACQYMTLSSKGGIKHLYENEK
jgi:hypothetical protein